VWETLALTQWPQSSRERVLGRRGKQLIRHLVFSISLNTPGRPPRARRLVVDRTALISARATILTAVQEQFRATRPLEQRTDRRIWLRTYLRQQIRRLTVVEADRHARRLAGRRPVDVANWIVGRQYELKPAMVQRLAKPVVPA
jgi:hypothetical protein